MNAGSLFLLAWRVVPRLPGALVRGIFDAVAVIAHAARIGGVKQLERNLERLRPDLQGRALRRMSRRGMRSYMRYYAESFQLPGLTEEQIAARVRAVGHEPMLALIESGQATVGALTHSGNWDLAGAWFVKRYSPVLTVAETLEPEELFRQFVEFREGLGLRIVPFAKGTGVFRRLLTGMRKPVSFVPLLADRDLSRDGLEVDAAGHPMRVAPGPAALALAARAALYSVHIHYERLHGDRRRRAGSPWGIVIDFQGPIEAPELPQREAIAAMTQRWVDLQVARIQQYPQDWHMLQKVFSDDLDADRLARASAGAIATDESG
ncbi:phosphatidylinositol mannoside acyltransferase [Pseudactinotalea suaedae]|uniref:phosphatidylinositol mannoside acyltransferase n=1 Tax=Pseudactinotalea suaedae TaxID=1524924 RepID=UPI0012E16256|nr:phosphatidylinositol mannoside acyltransferase [Pseudactinotalea suaedae]